MACSPVITWHDCRLDLVSKLVDNASLVANLRPESSLASWAWHAQCQCKGLSKCWIAQSIWAWWALEPLSRELFPVLPCKYRSLSLVVNSRQCHFQNCSSKIPSLLGVFSTCASVLCSLSCTLNWDRKRRFQLCAQIGSTLLSLRFERLSCSPELFSRSAAGVQQRLPALQHVLGTISEDACQIWTHAPGSCEVGQCLF